MNKCLKLHRITTPCNINKVCQVRKLAWTAMLHWSLNLEAVIWSPLSPLDLKNPGRYKSSRGLMPSKCQQSFKNHTTFLPLPRSSLVFFQFLSQNSEKSLENKLKSDITLTLLVSCSLVKCSSSHKTGRAELRGAAQRRLRPRSGAEHKATPWITGETIAKKNCWSVETWKCSPLQNFTV